MSAILLLIALLAGANVDANETCEKKLDVAFIADGSTSICGAASCPKWDAVLQFCKDIVKSLTIGPEQSRVAMMTASNSIEVMWDLTQITDETTLLSAIDNVTYPGGELTDAVSASEIILDVFNPLEGDRVADQNILVVITDGAPSYPDAAWLVPSTAIQADFVAVFFVCVTPGCTESLAQFVSSPPKQPNETYFLLDDYLKLDQIRDNVVKKFCAWTLEKGMLETLG